MTSLRNRKGQAVVEQAMTMAAVVIGLALTVHLISGGVQGSVKQASEQTGDQFSMTNTTYTVKVENTSKNQEVLKNDGENTTTLLDDTIQKRSTTDWKTDYDLKNGLTTQ